MASADEWTDLNIWLDNWDIFHEQIMKKVFARKARGKDFTLPLQHGHRLRQYVHRWDPSLAASYDQILQGGEYAWLHPSKEQVVFNIDVMIRTAVAFLEGKRSVKYQLIDNEARRMVSAVEEKHEQAIEAR